jgi:hypothetical protein
MFPYIKVQDLATNATEIFCQRGTSDLTISALPINATPIQFIVLYVSPQLLPKHYREVGFGQEVMMASRNMDETMGPENRRLLLTRASLTLAENTSKERSQGVEIGSVSFPQLIFQGHALAAALRKIKKRSTHYKSCGKLGCSSPTFIPVFPGQADKFRLNRDNEAEEPYGCQACHLRSTTPKQSKNDKNFVHFGTQSWACTAIDGVEAAFARLYPKVLNPEHDICCYYGQIFSDFSVQQYINHLVDTHKFGGCNQLIQFYCTSHLRWHLKEMHGALDGQRISRLESAHDRVETPSRYLKRIRPPLRNHQVPAVLPDCRAQR